MFLDSKTNGFYWYNSKTNQKLKFLIYDFYETSIIFFILGVLEHGADDFETVDDLYDAIGDMLLEVDGKGEDDIREICDRLMEVMKRYKGLRHYL